MNEATANRHLAATRPQVDRAVHTVNLATAWERIHTRNAKRVRTRRVVLVVLGVLVSIPLWTQAYAGVRVLLVLVS